MKSRIEEARRVLVDDLENHPSSLSNPIGDARTYHKILDYLFVCIKMELPKDEIADWLYELYKDQTDDEKFNFTSRIDLLIGALIDFHKCNK